MKSRPNATIRSISSCVRAAIRRASRRIRAKRISSSLTLERLEDRTLLAYTANVNLQLQTVTFTGNAAGDVLTFDEDSQGRLRHNRFTAGDPGFASNIDLDSTQPGVQSSNQGGNVNVFAGGGDDEINIGTLTVAASVFDNVAFAVDGEIGLDFLKVDDSANGMGAEGVPALFDLTSTNFDDVFLGYANIENLTITGGPGPEHVTIQSTADNTVTRLNGGGGDDMATVQATGVAGLTLDGQAGNDIAVISFGNLNGPVTVIDYGVTFTGTDGDNTITVTDTTLTADQTTVNLGDSAAAPAIFGGDGDDTIDASARTQPVILDGGSGSDTITGGTQNDTIFGGDGDDTLTGGAGSDTFRFDPLWGLDTVDADSTNDFDSMDFSAVQTRLFVTLGSVSVGDEFGNSASSSDNEIEMVITGAGDDSVNCLATTQKLVVQMGAGDDFVDCSASSQIMLFDGGAGDDSITGGSANDGISGGAGSDLLDGGGGDDAVVGGSGDDTLADAVGANTLSGGLGCDTINGVVDPPSCADPIVQFGAAFFEVNENSKLISIPVTLAAAPAGAATVTYTVTAGPGTSASDFTAKIVTLAFSPTQTTRMIAVKIKNDKIDEFAETVNLTLTGVSGAITMGEMTAATLLIRDDDATPTARFKKPAANVRESAGFVALTVGLSAASGRTVTVGLTTGNVLAADGDDYTGTDTNDALGTVTFAPGERTKVVQIPITNDGDDEPNETFIAHLNGSESVTAPPATANVTVTILDDDAAVAAAVFERSVHRRANVASLAAIVDLLFSAGLI